MKSWILASFSYSDCGRSSLVIDMQLIKLRRRFFRLHVCISVVSGEIKNGHGSTETEFIVELPITVILCYSHYVMVFNWSLVISQCHDALSLSC